MSAAQLELRSDARPVVCEWCGEQLASTKVVGTACCGSCAVSSKVRVHAGLQRWERGGRRTR